MAIAWVQILIALCPTLLLPAPSRTRRTGTDHGARSPSPRLVIPTIVSKTPDGASIDQSGIVLSVDKVEYAEQETRVYLTETNNTGANFNLYSFNMKIVQNGQQIDVDMASATSFNGDYPQLANELAPGASSSGVVVFPPIDTQEPFQLIADGYSQDMNIGEYGQIAFTFDLPAAEEKAVA